MREKKKTRDTKPIVSYSQKNKKQQQILSQYLQSRNQIINYVDIMYSLTYVNSNVNTFLDHTCSKQNNLK